MKTQFLTRRRLVLDQEVREPPLLAFGLTAMGLTLLLAACLLAIAGLPAFGYVWWAFALVAVILVGLVRRRQPVPEAPAPTGRQRWFRRLRGGARKLFIGMLTCWLGLILWSALCPGGPSPPPKADPALIRVITWNIHCGQDESPPWQRFDWPARKHALHAALAQARPGILCVQEARPGQVQFLEEALPGHDRVGCGREGQSGGEHCAIFYNRERFAELGSGTFWLAEPIDQPQAGWGLDVNRICTWARLRDQVSGRTLRVYNTHLYLTETPRLEAARLILAHVARGDPKDAVLLTADFNAWPGTPSRRHFAEGGLTDAAERAGFPVGKATFHFGYGLGVWCIDGILVDRHWQVCQHLILKVKPNNTFPSDHFALLADLALQE